MHPFIHRRIRQSLVEIQEIPTRLTEKARVEALIRKLRPQVFEGGLLRVGPEADGGYLVPDDLTGISTCFSPGVEWNSGFEMDCAGRGMQVFLADRSVDHPAGSHSNFHFTRKHLGVTTDAGMMTLDDWVSSSCAAHENELLLQIDIEGAEYEVFLGASDSLLRRFRILVAEFHSLDQLWNQAFFNLASRAFEKILQTHHCVHIHPNNYAPLLKLCGLEIPPVAEFTFLRKDRFTPTGCVAHLPHLLDRDNTPMAHIPLPPCWLGGH